MSPFSTSSLRALRAAILMDVDLATKPMCIISRRAIDSRDPMETKRLKRDGNQGTWDAPPDDFGWIRMWFLGWKFWCLIVRCWLVVWLPFFAFSHILGIIIPIDSYFSERGGPPTNQDVSGCIWAVSWSRATPTIRWRVYHGKSHLEMDDFGGILVSGTPPDGRLTLARAPKGSDGSAGSAVLWTRRFRCAPKAASSDRIW